MNRILVIILLASLIAFQSCDRFRHGETAQMNTTRIVCVSKQLTELLFALGTGDKIVGVDLSSTWPPEATKLPTVGYHRLLSAEGITSLHPTLLLHDGNVAPEAVLSQLKDVGIPIREFKADEGIPGVTALIKTLGQEFGATARADSLCAKLEADMKVVEKKRGEYSQTPRVLILHFGRVVNNYLVIGQRGVATKILEWSGGRNALDVPDGMKPLSAEIVAQAQPDVILLTDFGYDRLGGMDAIKQLPGVALTPAAKSGRIYRVEEHDLVYLGPRTGEVILSMMELIHRQSE
jgi:iron complex transport system substrate-binding protein